MLRTVLIHAAAGVTTICAAPKTVLIHEPSSKPRPSAPRMSASPAVVIRAFRVEMNAPSMTATTPIAGYSQRPVAGTRRRRVPPERAIVMAAAGSCRSGSSR